MECHVLILCCPSWCFEGWWCSVSMFVWCVRVMYATCGVVHSCSGFCRVRYIYTAWAHGHGYVLRCGVAGLTYDRGGDGFGSFYRNIWRTRKCIVEGGLDRFLYHFQSIWPRHPTVSCTYWELHGFVVYPYRLLEYQICDTRTITFTYGLSHGPCVPSHYLPT